MKYDFLQTVGTLPRIVQKGLELMGTAEIPGKKSNPVIMEWARSLGIHSIYVNDDIAWCGLFMAYVVAETGREPVTNPLWARNWAQWGVPADKPKLGDVLVFARKSGGHVGIYIAEDPVAYHVLGGNQGNMVSITRILKNRMVAARRPAYINQPASVNTYYVSAGGSLSTNEA